MAIYEYVPNQRLLLKTYFYFSMETQLYMNHPGKDSAKALVFFVRPRQMHTSKIEEALHPFICVVKMVITKHVEFFF